MKPGTLTLAFVLAFSLGCHGQVVRTAPNHLGASFHFKKPLCRPAEKPPESPVPVVDMKYLGAAGLFVRWGDDSILLGPYFSNPSLPRVLFGRWRADRNAIERGLDGIDISKVEGLLAGHAHYDHIGDFPVILEKATGAQVLVNRSGARALAPYAAARTTPLDENARQWVWLTHGGERRPIRFFPVVSSHAPQIDHYLWASRSVEHDWHKPWESHRFRQLRVGQPFALVIDLLAEDLITVRYRIYYQDSANRQGLGEPPAFPDGHPYDLAVLCIASYDKAPGQPSAILKALRPRHVLVAHYDDFFRPQSEPIRFVALLTDAKVEMYLGTICKELGCDDPAGGPTNAVCGPSGPRWTMPLRGDWLRFVPNP
jgi:L-ascorbate metabolism protein UlaG (beta-lactamase superfamily)